MPDPAAPASSLIVCDGCGQAASPAHLVRRFQRLEWATRYRPIHLHTLLLGAVSPANQSDFLYSPKEVQGGEAAQVLSAVGILAPGKTADAIHSEFHRHGLFLTHVLECPLETPQSNGDSSSDTATSPDALLLARLPAMFTRIRRSLKPKRLVLISASLSALVEKFAAAQLGCELLLDDGHPYSIDAADASVAARSITNLRQLLAVPAPR
jgi:hypothetical protein